MICSAQAHAWFEVPLIPVSPHTFLLPLRDSTHQCPSGPARCPRPARDQAEFQKGQGRWVQLVRRRLEDRGLRQLPITPAKRNLPPRNCLPMFSDSQHQGPARPQH